MKIGFFLSLSTALLLAACVGRSVPEIPSTVIDAQQRFEGDSTFYGLACDGCNDTILVLLHDTAHDPDTFNILEASRRQRVFGALNIGDKVGVLLNSEDSTVADIVIDLESMRGAWCYKAMPTLRRRADIPDVLRALPDSLRDSLFVPREFGFQIIGERNVTPIGRYRAPLTSDEELPVEYPTPKRYRDWRLFNGRLILSETKLDSLGQQRVTHSDTAEFVMLMPDSLVLRFPDGVHSYYRKQNTEE